MRPAGRESESFPLTGPDKKEKTFGPEELLVLACRCTPDRSRRCPVCWTA